MDVTNYFPSVLHGAWLTLQVALLSLLIALTLGMLGSAAKVSRNAVARHIATGYTTLIRGVPDLVLMLLVVFGGQVVANALTDWLGWQPIIVEPFAAGVVTLGVIFGAYFTETLRGAYLAVPRGQREAGIAIGLHPAKVFLRIVLPQMVRHALPGLGNNWLVLLKATAIVSVIGLEDMTRVADQAGRSTRQPFTFYLLVCALYLVMTAVSTFALRALGRRSLVGVKQQGDFHA